MSALSTKAQALPAGGAAPAVIDDLILARIACSGGATRAQIVRDLGPLVRAEAFDARNGGRRPMRRSRASMPAARCATRAGACA